MITRPDLARIRSGEATSDEARTIIRARLALGRGEHAAIYWALRNWTWNALWLQRQDDDLEGWYRVVNGTHVLLAEAGSEYADNVETLRDLVEMSLRRRDVGRALIAAPEKSLAAWGQRLTEGGAAEGSHETRSGE